MNKTPNIDIKIVEVGPRDGLQSEPKTLSIQERVDLIDLLTEANLPVIEVGSFVSEKWVPQMRDSASVYQAIQKKANRDYPVLVPNEEGMRQAIDAGVKSVALFASASETFSNKNINASISESLGRYEAIATLAFDHAIKMRGYVSCVMGCPYEGEVELSLVRDVSQRLLDFGCEEVSLGDTIGTGTVNKVTSLFEALLPSMPAQKLAAHFHDTYGQAIVNCYAAYQLGVRVFDSSVGGLGGCPYAKGASGNVATEDLVTLFEGMGLKTGIDLDKLLSAGDYICRALSTETRSKLAQVNRVLPLFKRGENQ